MAAALLRKLEPMAMMEDKGTEKARLALDLLEQRAADGGSAFATEVMSAGMRILAQTKVCLRTRRNVRWREPLSYGHKLKFV